MEAKSIDKEWKTQKPIRLASIFLCQDDQGCKGTWIWVGFDGDIFSPYEVVKAKGVVIRQRPKNHSWALEMQIEDPDGHVLRFGTEPNEEEPYVDRIN